MIPRLFAGINSLGIRTGILQQTFIRQVIINNDIRALDAFLAAQRQQSRIAGALRRLSMQFPPFSHLQKAFLYGRPNFPAAVRQYLRRQFTAEPFPVRRAQLTSPRTTSVPSSEAIRPRKCNRPAATSGASPDRHLTAAFQRIQKRPFRRLPRAVVSSWIAARSASISVSSARHCTASAPCRRRQQYCAGQVFSDNVRQPQSLQTGARQNDPCQTGFDFLQTCLHIAADTFHLQIRPPGRQLCRPPQAGCADPLPCGESSSFVPSADTNASAAAAHGDRPEHQSRRLWASANLSGCVRQNRCCRSAAPPQFFRKSALAAEGM